MNSIALVIPSLILLAGLVDDLRSKKVHNQLIIGCFVIAVASSLLIGGWEGLKNGLLGASLAFAIILPMFLANVLGGGDLKLMIVFGLASHPWAVFWVIIFSIFWGALLGVIHAVVKGEGISLLKSTIQAAIQMPKDKSKLHKIPYTVALVFGWLSYISLERIGALSL